MTHKPNFFIVGAPKCGTTSLATWLSEHPNIFFSPVKEPHHFNTDLGNNYARSRLEYERLFSARGKEHIAVGEGSVWYLYSQKAVPNILEYSPQAQFLVLLRNPVEMAYSLHEQLVFAGQEDTTDFGMAWSLQKDRSVGRHVPKQCEDSQLLLYGPACRLGEQVQRLFENVGKERVLFLFLDDIKVNPRREYLRVLNFLSVNDDGRKDFRIENSAKERRSMILRHGVMLANSLRRALGSPYLGTGIMRVLDRLNRKSRPRDSLTPDMRGKLVAYFKDDIEKLEGHLGSDLSSWIQIS